MSWLEALLLGIAQGLTEFFPVSSSGHLVMFQSLLDARLEGILFEVGVHAATLIAVVIFYRRRIAALSVGFISGDRESVHYTLKLILATVPAVVLVLLAGDILEAQFQFPVVAGICLLITGGLLWTTRWTLPRAKKTDLSWLAVLLIGCAQAFAILPGISRSGTTVVVALALGIEAVAAAEFSFLMSVIAISGAIVLKLPEILNASPDFLGTMAIGGIAALLSGLLALSLFIRFLRARSFHRFAFYAWGAGIAFLIWLQFS
ncbi:MAG: undecaprenyl-diphosphate phosphatase [Gammaproteobacteria bacterium]|nr:undecaprenyl-diphosphate phosphatase [Gammaproteobacteria bacterium]